VAPRDLVADQRIGGRIVGDAEQRLGEAHQHDAFLGRQAIAVHELRDERLAFALGLRFADQFEPAAGDRLDTRRRGCKIVAQLGDDVGFAAAGEGADRRAVGALGHGARYHIGRSRSDLFGPFSYMN